MGLLFLYQILLMGLSFSFAIGFHVLYAVVDTSFLFVCLLRIQVGRLRQLHHTGL